MKPTRAYTLIETLAVVTLLTLAVALLTPLVTGATPAAVLDSAVHGFRDLDARARLLAQGGGGATLTRNQDGLWIINTGEVETVRAATPWRPAGAVRIELRDHEGADLDTIVYNAAGRSPDYTVIGQLDDLSRLVRVAGLTGWSEGWSEATP